MLALYQPVVNGFSANLVAVQASRVSTWLWCSALETTVAGGGKSKTTGNEKNSKSSLGQADLAATNKLGGGLPGSLVSFVGAEQADGSSIEEKNKQDVTRNSSNEHVKKFNSIPTSQMLRHLVLKMRSFCKKLFWSFTNPSPNSIAAKLLLIMLIPAHTLYFLVIWLISTSSENHGLASSIHLTWSFYLVYLVICVTQVLILFLLCEPFMTLLMNRGFDPDIFGISILMALADLTGTLFLTGAFYTLAGLGDINARS